MINNKFFHILVLDGGNYHSMYEAMFHDLNKLNNCLLLIDKSKDTFIKRILLKEKVRKVVGTSMDILVSDKNELEKYIAMYSCRYQWLSVIFLNSAFYFKTYLPKTLKAYKEKYKNIKYSLVYLDIMNSGVSRAANNLVKNNIFDYIFTIDKNDALKNGFDLITTPYSYIDSNDDSSKYIDLYFCGALKSRSDILLQISANCQKNKILGKFDVIKDNSNQDDLINDIKLLSPKSFIPYNQQVKNVMKTNCILELVEPGQAALTLRAYEAVVYNKKLLTNNPSIFSFKFYNPKLVQYFNDPKLIDYKWIREETDEKYNYHNEFSPVHLLNVIEEKILNEE